MIDKVYYDIANDDSEGILTRDEMKKVLGGVAMAAARCKTVSCMVLFVHPDSPEDDLWPGDCDGDGASCYCNIGTNVGTVNSGGVSHCTVGH